MAISYHNNDSTFKIQQKKAINNWLKTIANTHKKTISEIAFIFCSDNALLEVNKRYLKHNTLTDIITFNYNENNALRGDIFISVERVIENAEKFGSTFTDELHRVMAHGILHLCGFNDKSKDESLEMKKQEDISLTLRNF